MKMTPNTLRWMDVSLPEPAENLQLDEQLLAEGVGVLRVWESGRECVVMGQGGRADREAKLDACEAEGVPVLRRCSGGGTVVLGPGCLNYALVLPLDWEPRWRDVAFSMQWVTQRVCEALGVPYVMPAGQSDLALHNKKVSGSAQRRTRHAFLHHGTLLYDFDVRRVAQLLQMPARRPPYRAARGHAEFLTNLPVPVLELKARLAAAWC
ncbi:MAG: lipoate--protein ligase family protein [Acidobacteria bacterium]|nr:lipoate--protein ligase family protein [Acidobacteriota bacterium]